MKKVKIGAPESAKQLEEAFTKILKNCKVFVCIGTCNVVSDSLGPTVGRILTDSGTNIFVYGTENFNVTALNLERVISVVKALHPDEKIAVVDAAVGAKCQIGEVQIAQNGIVPGAATGKILPQVGDFSIVGVVSTADKQDFYNESPERRRLVFTLAQHIANAAISCARKNAETKPFPTICSEKFRFAT